MKKITLLLGLACFSQSALSLETFKTNISLSNGLGDMYCQNIVHNDKSDWRMPSLPDLLQLLSEGEQFETTYCSNTLRIGPYSKYNKCIDYSGQLTESSSSRTNQLICIRGESEFSATPSLESCPTASFSMSEGILHIPLLNVPDLLGNIEKYDVHLKMTSDDLVFEFLRATKLD
ncbi:MAG: hypothetical protein GQ582_12035 [Methyloprofundus sp.]|nr:hypothetical protein [Methyloprofundus sp.]